MIYEINLVIIVNKGVDICTIVGWIVKDESLNLRLYLSVSFT